MTELSLSVEMDGAISAFIGGHPNREQDDIMTAYRIDNLQYANWSRKIFEQMRAGGLDAVHVTIAYHENFRETVANIETWNRHFENNADLIFQGRFAADVRRARDEGRTAIFFGLQNPSPIEDDIGLVEVLHDLGVRFMQLSYNNQSLLATGCYEAEDPGITRMGREVIREMNRVGLVVDMSHSADRSTFEAMEISSRPIAITHANPKSWSPALRNKSDDVLRALAGAGGMLGFSLYPHHLKDGPNCTLESFCEMAARTAELMGADKIGIGSDLCQDQPDSVVEWMRTGRWTKSIDYGEGSANNPGFPPMPDWYRDNRDFGNLAQGLRAAGFDEGEVDGILGSNWLAFYETNFTAAQPGNAKQPLSGGTSLKRASAK
ncbi:membrane dipeptidase [uncultured Nitratireductor sp.]|uniref:membrane dipeptidase n=1 Tax=uncultured Nitratireductor sp. TaxID=520953 RepID=UPI002625E4B8|nr:membrane dipeptidase [uncultured Nitratireductor sp.]